VAGVHRPAVSPADSPEEDPVDSRASVEAVWRIESARLVGALARYTGDFALAEDLAQEALAEALVSWPRDGVPDNPAGWLRTVGRRRAIDAFRRRTALAERYAVLGAELDRGRLDERWEAGLDPEHVVVDVLRWSSSPAIRCCRARPASR